MAGIHACMLAWSQSLHVCGIKTHSELNLKIHSCMCSLIKDMGHTMYRISGLCLAYMFAYIGSSIFGPCMVFSS